MNAQNTLRKPQKVLVLGSGGLKIGQAGEFDYSGSQALKALREEGVTTILINPNIATNQTSEGMADATFFLPVTPDFVRQVIEKERPDGILLSFGGQTALNCGLALHREGILYKYAVDVLGTPVEAIELTEDRKLFAEHLRTLGLKTPESKAAVSVEEAIACADEIGYPVMARAGFALGGAGSGICRNRRQLVARCEKAFALSPQVLVEEWLGGWKEIEYEVVRDSADNCIAVCNMENIDPLGIHTGESIVVAPSQTLTDEEYHSLRSIALKLIRSLGIVGECNIQYALDPNSGDYRIIEVNARLSRSSALASKATGYPLAYVAAKLALGYSLTELRNKVTGVTTACFEPALDYCVVKMPRWDLSKFKAVDTQLGSEMKSVGEVMAIGRNFEEALQKAIRMTGISELGLRADGKLLGKSFTNLATALKKPTDRRLFAIYRALAEGWTVKKINSLTGIDSWFISKIAAIQKCEAELAATVRTASRGGTSAASPSVCPPELLRKAKRLGFSDAGIARILGCSEQEVRSWRESIDLRPAVKQIDTLAAEYPAQTNYLYTTYCAAQNDIAPSHSSILVTGSGPYRIGSSVEFDWCAVSAAQTCHQLDKKTIMVNCNPETVSTDYDICDRLYFEELSFERLMDIYEFEQPSGVLLSMGGQIANNLALPLFEAGALILGTSPQSIDRAEDRHKFSRLLDELGIDQPAWKELTTIEEARAFASTAGYPVLVRPSYVLSGAAMNVAWDDESLATFLGLAADVSSEHPVVISKFIENAKEIEIDAVARHGKLIYHAITEHIENAGVHSGDATVVFPPQRLYIETVRKILRITDQIAAALNITGPFNIQFVARQNHVMVIECNLRASRSFPFCSKVSRVNMIDLAVKAMLGEPVTAPPSLMYDQPWVGVKAAQFSFSRLHGADPVLGVEMASTGEVGCIGSEFNDAFMKAMVSVGYALRGKKILLSTGPLEDKLDFIDSARTLAEMGCELYASRGTALFLKHFGIPVTQVHWPLEKAEPNILTMMRAREFDLVINIPKNNRRRELKNDFLIRRMAIDLNIPLFTNIKTARQYIESLAYTRRNGIEIRAWEEYH
ncbi:MAG: carbamoyl-phosphate synthase (glutamine-hydrolyzing) large subunit [Rectinema subterraneum]